MDHDSNHHKHHEAMFKRKFFVSTLLSLPVLYFSDLLSSLFGYTPISIPYDAFIIPVIATTIFIYGGLPFLNMARSEYMDGKPGMMMLISLAILVAYTYSVAALFIESQTSFFWELVTLIDIMLLGHWIEMRSVRQAKGALQELTKLIPDTAERVTDDGVETVKVDVLTEDDVVLVRPGARIPVDGEVIQGGSAVDESVITGESKPVDKDVGDTVIGGTTNKEGSLRVRVTATGENTTVSGIMRLVQDAQESTSEAQLLADRAAGWLFYVALGTGVLTALAWTVSTGFNVGVVERVVTVLVIACPHALGLAVPLVVAINTSLAAQNGILVRDRVAMELVKDIDTVVFDKTGTLTQGEMGVVDIEVTGVTEAEAIRIAASVEADSEHVIAEAIRRRAEEHDVDIPGSTGFEAIKGKGVRATIHSTTYYVGGPNLAEAKGFSIPDELGVFADEASEHARTTVYVFKDEAAVAAISLADVVRDESREAVDALHRRGVDVAMLTGDAQNVARAVAEELGIDEYFAEVLPDEKDEIIQGLQDQGYLVAMVGDGVNDAPALTRADVGIAIGSGTDVAVESADIILVKNNPYDIVKLFSLSEASYKKMVQNLWWAAGYNILALPLAAGVLAPWNIVLSPAVGAVIMSFSTVIVAANAQLLKTTDLSVDYNRYYAAIKYNEANSRHIPWYRRISHAVLHS